MLRGQTKHLLFLLSSYHPALDDTAEVKISHCLDDEVKISHCLDDEVKISHMMKTLVQSLFENGITYNMFLQKRLNHLSRRVLRQLLITRVSSMFSFQTPHS